MGYSVLQGRNALYTNTTSHYLAYVNFYS